MSPVLTVAELADALQVSRWCVYDRIRRGEIPTITVGRALRVPRVWLDRQITAALEVAS